MPGIWTSMTAKSSMESESYSIGLWPPPRAECVRSFCIPPRLWKMRLNAPQMSAEGVWLSSNHIAYL